MNRPLSAIAGGVTGIAVMSLLLLFLEVETRSNLAIFESVARFAGMPGNVTFGFILFVLAGVFAWPLAFMALERYIPGGPDPATRGMVLAVALWVVFVLTGRGGLSGGLLAIYVIFTLLAHLCYGFLLGAVYGRLTSEGPLEPERYDPSDVSQ
ncbi:DUF6789 family protein [Haloprofundus salinisoli]|uniref:DUF6789 family protein n=1 Tax=Haloprofundus salinisoli TaxID=2876193 RepID=UPI001CC9EEBC|nr:DUF6789 family protein [Haloprofundus salinisoli]